MLPALFPLVGAVALGGGTVLERYILKKRGIGVRLYQTATFAALVLVMLPLLYFFWDLNPEALTQKNLIIFGAVIVFSMMANLFVFYSMKWEKVTHLEPAKMLEPLFVIILAIILSFFIDSGLYERNIKVIIPALIAALAIIFSHVKKHHITFNKYFLAAIIGSFFFALELITSRLILDFYNPITFYFLRCSSIFLLSLILFRPNFKNLNQKTDLYIILVAVFWATYRIIIYYGYLTLGVIFTTLIIMLGPLFIYLFASKFLHEKLEKRNIIAAAIIILCVLYAVLS